MDESQEDWEQDWAKNQKEYDNRVVLPFTYEMVEAARNRGELFTRAQVHDVILRCWETLKNRPKNERGMVRVDITHSRPWQKVIAAASDKIRRGLVGPGIVSCHLEMDENRLNPHNSLPHPQLCTDSWNWCRSAVSSREAEGFLTGTSLQDWWRREVWHGEAKQGRHNAGFSTCHEGEEY